MATKQPAVLDREPVVMRTQIREWWGGEGGVRRNCLPSLDEIAGGLYVDITKINWIPVICSKCDTVMWSYESGSAARNTMTVLAEHTMLPLWLLTK